MSKRKDIVIIVLFSTKKKKKFTYLIRYDRKTESRVPEIHNNFEQRIRLFHTEAIANDCLLLLFYLYVQKKKQKEKRISQE